MKLNCQFIHLISLGSPYAIVNYSLNYELGDMDDLVPFKKMLNNIGLGLMLDFVPNHYAIDSKYLTPHCIVILLICIRSLV